MFHEIGLAVQPCETLGSSLRLEFSVVPAKKLTDFLPNGVSPAVFPDLIGAQARLCWVLVSNRADAFRFRLDFSRTPLAFER
jgi:hypothetical protein